MRLSPAWYQVCLVAIVSAVVGNAILTTIQFLVGVFASLGSFLYGCASSFPFGSPLLDGSQFLVN